MAQNVVMQGTMKQRADIVAYMWIPEDTPSNPPVDVYQRMQGFSEMAGSRNPIEYSRQYVDEQFERTDVVGFSPQTNFNLDRHIGNPVHDFMAEIIDNELIGSAAQVRILFIDFTKDETEDNAFWRTFALIADTEGDVLEAYTNSGSFRAVGPRVLGRATVSEDGTTATFVPSAA